MGLPGAGKSTLAKTLRSVTGAEVVSSDEMRVELFTQPCFSQDEHDTLYMTLDSHVSELLREGKSAIYDANLNRKIHRTEKYELAKKLDIETRLWWVQTPKALAKQRRISEQNHILLPEGETPDRMFERIASVLEPPSEDEKCTIVDGTRIDVAYIKELL